MPQKETDMSKKPETDAFAMPSFDASKVTDQFRDFAEKGLAQSKDAYAKMKTATEEAQKTVEETFKSVQTAGADVSLKAIAALRAGQWREVRHAIDAMGEEAGDRYVIFNSVASIFGQASIERVEFMGLLGVEPTTPLGLPGIGDCFVTAMGGRNVKCGRLVGAGLTFSEARAKMPGVTLEGAAAIGVIGKALVRLTERGVVAQDAFPLLRHLYEVVGLDQPVNVPWGSFFGANGSGR